MVDSMVNLELIFKSEEKLVNDVIQDIRENNFAWDVLQYVNNHYAEVEIDHGCFSDWNKEEYEQFLHTDDKEAEIRINRGFVCRYVNVHGNTELDRDWDDTEEEWEEYRDCWEEYTGRETECVPEYVKYETK